MTLKETLKNLVETHGMAAVLDKMAELAAAESSMLFCEGDESGSERLDLVTDKIAEAVELYEKLQAE